MKSGGFANTRKEDKAFIPHSSALWTGTLLRFLVKAYNHFAELTTTRSLVFDMVMAQEMGFELYKTLNGCVIVLNTIPPKYLNDSNSYIR